MTNLVNKKHGDILSEPPKSTLKSIIKCPCNCSYRFNRDCHILRHLRFENFNDVINTQKIYRIMNLRYIIPILKRMKMIPIIVYFINANSVE